MKEGRFKGNWWFPKSKDITVRGDLIISNDELTLETDGILSNSSSVDLFESIPIIHGKLQDGKIITLYSCFWMGRENSEGIHVERYNIDYVLEGAHFSSPNEMKFKTISLVPEHLDIWLWESTMDISFGNEKTTVTFQNAKEQKFKIDDKIEFQIYTSCGPSVIRSPLHDLEIKQRSHLKLHLSEFIGLSQLVDVVRHIQNFLSFSLGAPTRIIAIAG